MKIGNLTLTPWAYRALDAESRARLDERAGKLGCTVGAVFGREQWRAGATGSLGRTDAFARRCEVAMGLALDAYEKLVNERNHRIGLMADEADRFDPDELWDIYEASREAV